MFKAKNKLAKRILAFVLSGAMIFSNVAPTGTTAVAAETSTDTGGEYQEETADTNSSGDDEAEAEKTSESQDNASDNKENAKETSSSETVESTTTAETKTEDEEQASETKSSFSEEKESAVKEEKESEEKTTAEEEEKDEKDEDVKEYTSPTEDSKIWPVYAGTFKGSVFGEGVPTSVVESTSQLKVNDDGSMNVTDKSNFKMSNGKNGMQMYYYQLDADLPFTFKARAIVKTNGAGASTESTIGLMARDDMYVDQQVTGLNTNLIAACATNKDNSSGAFVREGGTLSANPSKMTITTAAIDVEYDLGVSYDGSKYTIEVNGQTYEKENLSLTEVDSQYIYVGMFATRKMGADFDRIYLATGLNDKDVVMDQRAKVSGSITGVSNIAEGTKIIFTDKTTTETIEGKITETSNSYQYTADLYAGTYSVSVGDYDLISGDEVTIENKAATQLDAKSNDIVLKEVEKTEVSGSITIPADAEGLADLTLVFTKDGKDVKVTPQTTDGATTYTTKLAAGTYDVKVTAKYIEDYNVDISSLIVGTTAITNGNIILTEKSKQSINIIVTSYDEQITELPSSLIFTRTGENDPAAGYTYEVTNIENVRLREGTYSVGLKESLNDLHILNPDSKILTVGDSSTNYTLDFAERMTWDFTGADPELTNTVKQNTTGKQTYHGLEIDTAGDKKITGTYVDETTNEAVEITTYGKFEVQTSNDKRVQVNASTELWIPVEGKGTVTISSTSNPGYTMNGEFSKDKEKTWSYENKPKGSTMKLQVIGTKYDNNKKEVVGDSLYLTKIAVERTGEYVPSETAAVTGEIDFPDGTLPTGFKLVFESEDGDKPEVTIDDTQTKPTYAVNLQKDTEYTISAEGANDYEITAPSPATVNTSEDTTVNIMFAEKQKCAVKFSVSGDEKPVQAQIRVTLTHTDGTKETVIGENFGQDTMLKSGTWSIEMNDLYPYMLAADAPKNIIIGETETTATCEFSFVERMVWDFTVVDPMITSGRKDNTTFNGLVITGPKFDVQLNDKKVQVNDTTVVKVPVSGKGTIQIVAGSSTYTVDGVAATENNTTCDYDVSQAAETDRYVTVAAKGGTLWLNKIIVTREEVPGEEEEITGKIVFPEGETIPDGLTITFTPTTGTAAEADITGDDYTVTLNKDITYTISVAGASGYTFTPEKMSTATTDKTITFTKKPAVSRTEWSFKSDSDLRQILTENVQGKKITLEGLEIDATASGAKFTFGSAGDWAQVNQGTIIKVPVKGACKITVEAYKTTTEYTVDGITRKAGGAATQSFICAGTDGWVEIKMTGSVDSYLGNIKIDNTLSTIKVSGNVTGAPSGCKITFTGKTDASGLDASKLVVPVGVTNNKYETELYKGITYAILLNDDTYAITVPENAELTIAESDTSKDQDITVEQLSMVTVSGTVSFPTDINAPSDLKLQFAKDGEETPSKEVSVSEGKYTVDLERDTVYAISATGIGMKDYTITPAQVDTTTETSCDITFTEATTYPITVTVDGLEDAAFDISKAELTFTDASDDTYEYKSIGTEGIELRDGDYVMSMEVPYPHMLDFPKKLKVNGKAASLELNFTERMAWDFTAGLEKDPMLKKVTYQNLEEQNYNGLLVTTNPGKFGVDPGKNVQLNQGTIIKVPVSGKGSVQITTAGAQYTHYKIGEQEITEAFYSHRYDVSKAEEADKFVTIEITANNTYFEKIVVERDEEVVIPDGPRKIDVWDFGGKVEADTKYNNNITPQMWLDSNLLTTEPEEAPNDRKGIFRGTKNEPKDYSFGDLTMHYIAQDRLYSNIKELETVVNGAGAGTADYAYSDYTAAGGWYCNGSGNADSRNITITNVRAGDIIVLYAGQHLSNSNGDEYGPITYHFEGGGQSDKLSLDGTSRKYDKFVFIAQNTGTYKIWPECENKGKPLYNRVVRIPGVKVSGTIDFGAYTGTGHTVKFLNETTKVESEAELDGNNFTVYLAPGYKYTAILSGAAGYGFASEGKTVEPTEAQITSGIDNVKLTVEAKDMYTYTGKFTGFAEGYNTERLAVTLMAPKDSNADNVILKIADDLTFTADLECNLDYTIQMEGVDDYVVKEPLTVTGNEDVTADIVVELKTRYAVTGGFIGLEGDATVTALKFNLLDEKGNVDKNYIYTATVNNGSYSVELRDGAYIADATVSVNGYKTETHVVVEGKNVVKDLMFVLTATGEIPRAADIYVGYPGQANNYKTIREAVKAAKRMPKPASEEERITIHIAPGTYREQVIVDVPYITFTNDEPSKQVLITWYYGIGYVYYSAKGGYYNEASAHDKYEKGKADRWGCAVKVASSNFRAENIVFENSFSRYITEEELADGVELRTEGTDSLATFVRKASSTKKEIQSKAAVERAAAIALDADNAEFYKCKFYGSQDTVYTGSKGVHSYFKDCFIEGNTDFLFGDSNSVYDNCTLSFAGYSDEPNNNGGIIAVNQAESVHGYLFTGCTITRGKELNNGFGLLGRPWRANAKVIFENTVQESADLISDAGWTDMSDASAKDNPNYYEYNTTLPDGTEITLKTGSVRELKYRQPDPLPNKEDYFDDWKPFYLTYDETTVVKPPISSAESSDLPTGSTIELSCATEGAQIYYAIGETEPAEADWVPYEIGKPISLGDEEGTVTIWAYAVKNKVNSVVKTFIYKVASAENLIAKPEASVEPGEVEKGTTVRLTCATEGADIYFTIDGTDPEVKPAMLYKKQAIVISKSMTIKAIAAKDANVSKISEFAYTVADEQLEKLTAPTASSAQGEVEKGTEVTLISKEGADIYYTINGDEPTAANGTKYEKPIVIDKNMTIKAIAVLDGYQDSASVTFTYTVKETSIEKLTAPTATPDSGEVAKGREVVLNSAEEADIYYTTDGKDPLTNGTKYETPIVIDKDMTIKAVAKKDGYEDSETATFTYTVTDTPSTILSKPVATPGAGEVEKGTEVTLTSAEEADIYYTTDGKDPLTNGTKYETPIVIDKDMTITAIATKDGYENSNPAEYKYTVKTTQQPGETVEVPVSDTEQGEVEKGTVIRLTSATEGAKIYYTTDETTPTAESTECTGLIPINKTVTITAIAIKDGVKSAVVTYKYTVAEDTAVEIPDVYAVRFEDCEVIVPSIIRNTSKKADPKQPSTTYVRYTYTDETGNKKTVKFAEELDYTVQWNGADKNDPYTYSVTLKGLGRTVRGRSVDGFIIDEASTCTVKYAVVDKPTGGNAGRVVDVSKIKVSLDASSKNRVYTGYAIEPGVDFSKSSIPSDKLCVTYRNNINAGKAEVIISAKPGLISDDDVVYVGSKVLKFNIKKATINKHSSTAIAKDVRITWDPNFDMNQCIYSGKDIKVDGLKVTTTAGKELRFDKDYKVTYRTNFRSRKVTVTVKGAGNNVSGSWSQNFTINPISLESLDFSESPRMLTYSPKGAKLTEITGVNKTTGARYALKEGVDFTAKYNYSDRKTKAAGSSATIVISGKGACTGRNIALDGRFQIVAADFENVQLQDDIVVDSKAYAKNMSNAVAKAVVVKDESGATLKLKKDYYLTYDYNKHEITVKPVAYTNYKENSFKTAKYRVATRLSSDRLFAFNKKVEKADPMKYDGRNPVEILQVDIDKYINIPNGTKYVLGQNIEIVEGTYKNNTRRGTGQVTIKGIDGVDGGFYGTKVLKFKIVDK